MYKLKGDNMVDKSSDLVHKVKEWVDAQYADGRVTVITDTELFEIIDKIKSETEFDAMI